MSITLELTPQEEELVRNAAQNYGQRPEAFVKERLLQALSTAPTEAVGEWDLWATAGHAATDSARADLRTHGIAAVYQRDSVVVEELPNGMIRPTSL